ncbi:7-cyano-7-deazaguanine synthase QueC [Candidatus Peregrinibacteria bacterium CG_4_9_14_0_2_um_filter_53_11]|nr:MAG: 7-cyano-7-deazaguanine synthase QueC [Candidatus Peregrinibacteria bacterium CG_4_9_14_0_2_um_filter_53_11]
MKTLLIYSGGMDSTTLLYKLLADGDEVRCISFDYGQRHKKELEYARRICEELGVEHSIIDVRSLNELMQGSALTSDIPVPEGHYEDENMKQTVVPNRNMIFISLAMAQAISLGFERVALAVHAGDHAIYPDCRPIFIQKMQAVAAIANYEKLDVFAPFLTMSKGEIAEVGRELGVPFEKTWTCYKGLAEPCGKCGSCVERGEALG